MDYFRYFMPASGNYTIDGQYMAELVRNQGYGPDDFFIYAATGTSDFAYSSFDTQLKAMMSDAPDMFKDASANSVGNILYYVRDGYSHDYPALSEYTYNGLCFFWND